MPALEMPQMVTAWKCPECKLFNRIEEGFCSKCKKVLQQYENEGVPLDEMIFEVELDLLQQAQQQVQQQAQKED